MRPVPDTLKAAVLYAALTVLFTYPLSIPPGQALFGDNPDTHLFIWTLAWDAHAFLHQPLDDLRRQHLLPEPTDARVF